MSHLWKLYIYGAYINNIKIIRNKNYNRVIFDYFNVDYAQLREDAQNIDWNEIIKACNVEDDWVTFKKVIIDI